MPARRRRRTDQDPVEPPPGRLAVNPREAAYLLGCHTSTIYVYMRRGILPRVKLGSSTRIPRKAIDDLLAGRTDDERATVG